MNSSGILSIVTFIYAFSAVMYIAGWIFKQEMPGKLGTGTAILAAVANAAGMLLRWRESYALGMGHAPLSNLYESLVFFALTIIVLYLFMERKLENKHLGAFAAPLAFFAMAYASLSPNISDRIQPLLPALKSNWLIAHVLTCFLGYAAFAIAFAMSIIYLVKEVNDGPLMQRLPVREMLDELTHQMIMFGFLFLTLGIITGSVWANSAWGTYWSWDPKETWSLITWFIYATLLHARLMRGWSGKRIAILSLIGFMAVMFTYFGVNYLPGLHSYGAS